MSLRPHFLPLLSLARPAVRYDDRVDAAYLFLRDGQPLVSVSADRWFDIEPELMESILSIVADFVETSLPVSYGYEVTSMRFDDRALTAVRGRYILAATLHTGPEDRTVRSELVRLVRRLEDRFGGALGTFETAVPCAEPAAEELSRLVRRAESANPTEFNRTPRDGTSRSSKTA